MTILTGTGALTVDGAGPDTPGWVSIRDGAIDAVGAGPPPAGCSEGGDAAEVVEVDGVLAPGFVDLQVNGVDTVDFATADVDGWGLALAAMATHGVTACLPTIVSHALDRYDAMLDVAAACVGSGRLAQPGAVALGVHLEGPFLGGCAGAHDRSVLRPADPAWLAAVLDARPGLVRLVTLAPEADPQGAAIRLLAQHGIVVSVGHTAASYDEVCAAADAGAVMATHLFNGMAPLHHRAPGPVGAALERLVPSVIADLVHVHPAVLRLVVAAAPRAVLVTDQVAGAGLDRHGGAYRLSDGTLAGSATPMDRAVANLVAAGVPLARAADMASTAPADLLADATRGRLSAGRRGDVVALDRRTGELRAVWVGGMQVR